MDCNALVISDVGGTLLFERALPGVVVANARDRQRPLNSQTYHARRPEAAGVLEGGAHWLQIQSALL